MTELRLCGKEGKKNGVAVLLSPIPHHKTLVISSDSEKSVPTKAITVIGSH